MSHPTHPTSPSPGNTSPTEQREQNEECSLVLHCALTCNSYPPRREQLHRPAFLNTPRVNHPDRQEDIHQILGKQNERQGQRHSQLLPLGLQNLQANRVSWAGTGYLYTPCNVSLPAPVSRELASRSKAIYFLVDTLNFTPPGFWTPVTDVRKTTHTSP